MAAGARALRSLARFQTGILQPRMGFQPGVPAAVVVRCISTSKKNKDTVALPGAETLLKPEGDTQVKMKNEKNWVSWGFNYDCQETDNTIMHINFFVFVTLCLVTTGFYLAYLPDYGMLEWAQREGFLELRRREAAGLPKVDPDLIPADKIKLPMDEELGDMEIII